MRSFPGQNFRSEAFPNFYGEFVEGSEGRDERNPGGARYPLVKLFSRAFVRKIFYPLGQARRTFSEQFPLRPAGAQESFGQTRRDECS